MSNSPDKNPLLGTSPQTAEGNPLQLPENKQPQESYNELQQLRTKLKELELEYKMVDFKRGQLKLENQSLQKQLDEQSQHLLSINPQFKLDQGKRALNPLYLAHRRMGSPDPDKIPQIIKHRIARQFDGADEDNLRASSSRYSESLKGLRAVSAAASNFTGASSRDASIAYHTTALDGYFKVLKSDLERHEVTLGAMKKRYHAGTLDIPQSQYSEELAKVLAAIQSIKARMITCRTGHTGIVGTLVDVRRWVDEKEALDMAYIDALIRFYPPPAGYHTVVTQVRRNEKTQEDFRYRAIAAYDAKKVVEGDAEKEVKGYVAYWCPIESNYQCTSAFSMDHERIAAHIVPYNMTELQAEYIFGQKSKSIHGHIWDADNCLFMSARFEKAFDAAIFIIVPVNPKVADGRYKIVVIDSDVLKTQVTAHDLWGRNLDGRELVFLGEFRPDPLKIYFSALMNVFRRQRHEAPGWWRGLKEFLVPPSWAAASQLPRSSTLKAIARRMGQCADDELEFLTFLDDEKEEPDVELDEVVADMLEIPKTPAEAQPADEWPEPQEEDEAAESSKRGRKNKNKKKGKKDAAENSDESGGGGKQRGKQVAESPEAETSQQGGKKGKKNKKGKKGKNH